MSATEHSLSNRAVVCAKSEEWEPGDGWVEIDKEQPLTLPYVLHVSGDGLSARYWVPEEPVPPLPAAPYTVVRVTWLPSAHRSTAELAFFGGDWVDVDGSAYSSVRLAKLITGFEVLAVPVVKS